MQLLSLFASATSKKTSVDFAIEGLEGVGGLVVIVVAFVALSFLASVFVKALRKKSAANEPSAAESAPVPSVAGDIPQHHAKIVAAAALHIALKEGLGNPHLPVILAAAAQAVAEPAALQLSESSSGWSLEGRRSIFASHILKRR